MFLFSGIFFPVENLPDWAQTIAWFLPLTHGVSTSRALFAGTLGWEAVIDTIWLVVFFIAAFLVAVRSVRKRIVM
jgi:lipooligosaccharide transport system permease protein